MPPHGKRSFAHLSADGSEEGAAQAGDGAGKRQRLSLMSGQDILSSLSSSARRPAARKRTGESENSLIGGSDCKAMVK